MKISWKKIKDTLCNNVILKIVSVIVAVAMWLLVINIEDPQVTTTIKSIPVHILNESEITGNNEAYDILSGDTVDIKVTGPRTIVDALSKDDFTATADFKDLSKTNAVPIDISINNTRYESKITISDRSENAMRLSVMELVEKEYEISVQTIGTVQKGYVLYSTSPKESSVVIKAPETVHEQIKKVALLLNLSGEEQQDFSYICGVAAYDYGNKMLDQTQNHMTISNSTISVDGVVYYKKTVDINYNIVNNMGDDVVLTKYDVSADTTEIVGIKEKVDEIESIDIPEIMTTLTKDKTEIEIDLNDLLPEGVMLYNEGELFSIKAETESVVNKVITLRTGDIGIKNIPDGYEASISSSGNISIVLSGRQTALDELDAEKIAPYVDLSSANVGENNLNVNVVLPDEVSMTDNVRVMVVLTEKGNHRPDDETTTQAETTTKQPETTTVQEETTTVQQPQTTTETETAGEDEQTEN